MSVSEDKATESSVTPVLPRYRWLKRIFKLGGLVLVGMLLLRWWWGWEAHRRLQAEIDRVVARGEPIYPEDFDPPEEAPDDRNAALSLIKAAQLILPTTAEENNFHRNVRLDDELTSDQWQLLATMQTRHNAAFNLVRHARSLRGADWKTRFRDPSFNLEQVFPDLAGQQQLARTLAWIAVYQFKNENDRQAIETLRDLFSQAKAVDQYPTLVSHLIAISIAALSVSRIEYIVPDLAIGESPAANPNQILELISELLDEQGVRRRLRTAMHAERMLRFDLAHNIAQGRYGLIASSIYGSTGPATTMELVVIFPVRPLFALDGRLMMLHMEQVLLACEQPGWPQFSTIIAPLQREWETSGQGLGRILRPLSGELLPSLGRAAFAHYRAITQRRMAAIALAIRLYELDHGRRPVELAEMVPDYLDEVPGDPMAPDGKTFRYLPDVEIPVLYSVGKNGIDDGGLVWDEKRGEYVRHNGPDLVFLLDGVLPDVQDRD